MAALLALFSLTVGAFAERRAIRIPIPLRYSIEILFGSALTNLTLQLNTNLPEIIVVDRQCGQQSSDCARYCEDSTLKVLFCPQRCHRFTPQSLEAICGRSWRLDPPASASAQPMGNWWRRRTAGSRWLEGRIWRDSISVEITPQGKPEQRIGMRAEFASAMFFDKRLLDICHGHFGLGAGPQSAVESILRLEGITTRKLSISLFRRMETVKLPNPPKGSYMLTFGGFDGVRCADWTLIPSISTFGWVLEAEEVEFFGFRIKEKMIITFNFLIDAIMVPQALAARLLERRVIVGLYGTRYRNTFGSPKACKNESAYFRVGDFELGIFGGVGRTRYPGTPTGCRILIITDERNPHNEHPVITVGGGLLDDLCVGFDYERNSVAFGRNRVRPAFPLLPD